MKKNLLILFLISCCFVTQVMAQNVVRGKVTNEKDGIAIPGVTIRVEGSPVVAVTGADGNFSIRANAGQVLTFTFIGYASQKVTVGTSTVYNVKLRESQGTLNEVVVTAYGIERGKPSLGYSTPTVKGDDVSQTQREDFFGGLQGRVAGLNINSTNGSPGASAQIVLRGFTSISGDNNALIVMDGVPINNTTLNQTTDLVTGAANRDQDYSNRAMDINPYDIESYTIMKGPEATALYGSAGAGGAILITTKKGKAGNGTVTYTNSFRLEHLNKFPEIQHAYNTGTNGVFSAATTVFLGPAFLPNTPIYDNIHNFYQTGFTQKHNVALEGGTDKYTYRWSNEYSDQHGTIPTTQYTRFSSRLTGSAVISPLLKVTTTLAYMNTNNVKGNKGPNGTLMSLLRFSSAFDINQYQNPDGTRLLHYTDKFNEYDNPLWDVYKDPAVDKGDRFIGNVNFTLKPINWFTVNAIFGTDVSANNGTQVYNGDSYRGSGSSSAPRGGSITAYQNLAKIYNGSITGTARTKMGNSFTGTYIVGTTLNDFNSNTFSQYGSNFYDPNFYNINNTLPTTRTVRNTITRYRSVGAFAQAVLGYKALLYVTLTGRVDGTSRLMPSLNANGGTVAEAHPYFGYPSASMAFNFSELKAVKDALPFLDRGKLRASYALTGKEPFRNYALGTSYVSALTTGGGYALSVNAGNPTLKPETSKNFEVGTELSFLNDRIGLDFNYYNLISENQIINPRLSYASGFVLELINGGTVRNRGFEVELTTTPVRGKNFSWDANLNFWQNRGVVLSIANQLPELYDSDTWVVGNIRSAASPGASTGNVTGTRFDRNNAGQILISPTTGMPTVSDATFYPIGDRTPKFNMSLENKFKYKNLSLSFLWDLRYGGDVINDTEYEIYVRGISVKTLDRETPRVITGVLKDGFENTDHPTPNTISLTPYANSNYYSTNVAPEMFVEHNIKALRLRDATLRYNFSPASLRRIGFIKSLGVFFTVTDAILITNYSGTDPETNATNASSPGIGGQGIDYGNVGKPMGFNLGLSVKL